MSDAPDPVDAVGGSPGSQEFRSAFLEGRARSLRYGRSLFSRLPGEERCQLCAAPLDGPAVPAVRLIGNAPWP
mgnify:FL=1